MLGSGPALPLNAGHFSERFVTKRGDCRGRNAKVSWTQVETGSAITCEVIRCLTLRLVDKRSRSTEPVTGRHNE